MRCNLYSALYYYQRSTCFRRFFCSSSGAYKTVCAALGIVMLSCCLPLVWMGSSSSFLLGPVANAPGCTSASVAYCTYPALDVPTFTTSHLSCPQPASDPGSQSQNYVGEKWPINFAETPTSTKRLGIFYMP
jgi:hypothetical protein